MRWRRPFNSASSNFILKGRIAFDDLKSTCEFYSALPIEPCITISLVGIVVATMFFVFFIVLIFLLLRMFHHRSEQ
jgi:hypothetical protein